MSPAVERQQYDSYAAFYEDVYGRHIAEVRLADSAGAALFDAAQSAGDWSDAPTPDLVLTVLRRSPVLGHIDQGHGRFSGVMRPGQVVLTPPRAGTSIVIDGSHTLRILAVPYARLLGLAGTAGELPEDGDFGGLHAGYLNEPPLAEQVDRLWREAFNGAPHGTLFVDGVLLQIAAMLLRLRDGRGKSTRGGLAPWQVRRVTECLDAHLDEDVALADLAQMVELSPNHFCTAFRISLGEPPHRYLVRRRIERAREMLANPRLSITEVALAIGFGSSAHFATAFRKQVGVTPSMYRQEVRP